MKLYDSVVIPTLLYGSEVWGFSYTDMIESAQQYFFKSLLFLDRATPGWALRIETGRVRLGYFIFKRRIKWLANILKMNEARYPYLSYKALINLSGRDGKLSWFSSLKNIFNELGMDFLCRDGAIEVCELELYIPELLDRFKSFLMSRDRERALRSDISPNYARINPELSQCNYLQFRLPVCKVRLVAQVRLATRRKIYFYLEGQKSVIRPSDNCPVCNLQVLETLNHVLFVCPL